MDTLDRLMPREAETAADLESSINRDADFNPDAVVDDPGGKGSPLPDGYVDNEEVESWLGLSPWQITAAVAGGIAAVAVVAGLAGVAYWRVREAQREEMLRPKTFWAKAHPRQLSLMAGRRIEQLPVRDVQQRIANRVSHLFD